MEAIAEPMRMRRSACIPCPKRLHSSIRGGTRSVVAFFGRDSAGTSKPGATIGMTLIELLTVIAIIGILAGIVIPVLFSVLRNAKRSQAQTEVNLIATAVKAYQREYQRLPFQTSGGLADIMITATMNNELQAFVGILTTNTTYNPRQIDFLKTSIPSDNILRDPWRTPYAIAIDLSADDSISVTNLGGWSVSDRSVIVLSYGPDKVAGNPAASLNTQWANKLGDNIYSQ